MNHGEGRVGTASRLTVQRILRVDRVEPFVPAPFGAIFEIELARKTPPPLYLRYGKLTCAEESFSSEA